MHKITINIMSSTKSGQNYSREKYLKMQITASLAEFNYLKHLDDVIYHVIAINELGFYESLLEKIGINRTGWRKTIKFGYTITKEEMKNIPFIKLAYENLSDSIVNFPWFHDLRNKDLISFLNFYLLYKLLEAIYFINIGRKLKKNDINNIYSCGLGEQIVFASEEFNDVSMVIEPLEEFFTKLKEVKWENKKVNKFFKKLSKIRADLLYEKRRSKFYSNPTFPPLHRVTWIIYATIFPRGNTDSPYFDFQATEDAFLLFLAGCSAVNDNRIKINENDVIKAYKIYHKLLTTDIPKLVDKLWEEKSAAAEEKNLGYLVCEKCGGYYELQPGESPEDFSDECECGSKLEYHKSLSDSI